MSEERVLKTVKSTARRSSLPRRKLGEVLIETGLINVEHLKDALKTQRDTGKRLGDLLVEKKYISEEEMALALALQLKIEYIDLNEYTIESRILEIIPRETATRFTCVGINISNNLLEVAMADPLDLNMIKDLQFVTGYKIKPAISTASQIQDILQKHYNPVKSLSEVTSEFENDEIMEFLPDEKGIDEDPHTVEEFKDSPFVKMVDLIIRNAIKRGASDVHIEAQENHVRVRNRIDGVLQDSMPKLPKWTQPIIISRIKVLGGMDISERRLPQDGRIKVRSKSMSVDLRVSTLPTYYGEKAVIRILNKDETSLRIKDLGFIPRSHTTIRNFINQPQGMILITGPTGSGKTSSLYACMSEVISEEINIITVEDPVEYELHGINQVQINEKVGLTFPSVLRSILRQDPNVIMIGEIRDKETAEIALQAALTGHLVLSTLHTNDAPSAVTRLVDIGMPPYLITSSILGVVAQRLVRKICPNCKEEYIPEQEILSRVSLSRDNLPFKFYRGAGCNNCGQVGYKGRTLIDEVMVMGHKIRELIHASASVDIIREAAIATGMTTLGVSGMKKVEAGITTIDEVLKAVQQKEELTTICPSCGKGVSLDFKDCPFCKQVLVPSCASCGRISQPGWVVCPYCRSDLTAGQ